MPPKAKAKSKAKAKATQKQKQKQTQVVNIKIGETAKPKRKYTRKPKGKSVVKDELPDGWLPPQNISRSGQVWGAPYERPPAPYLSAPPTVSFPPEILQRIMRLEQSGSAGGFAPPRPPEPSLLMMGEPEPTEPPEPPSPSFVETPARPPKLAIPSAPAPKLNLMGELKQKLIERERKKLEAPPPESFVVPPPPSPNVLAPIDLPELEPVEEEEETYIVRPKKQSKQSREEKRDFVRNYFDENQINPKQRSLIIRKALQDIKSPKAEDKKAGIDKLTMVDLDAVISIINRMKAGEQIVF